MRQAAANALAPPRLSGEWLTLTRGVCVHVHLGRLTTLARVPLSRWGAR